VNSSKLLLLKAQWVQPSKSADNISRKSRRKTGGFFLLTECPNVSFKDRPMTTPRGLLISFDGIDSSGKETQTRLLVERLRFQGRVVRELATPDYDTASGQEIKLRLQNKLGQWSDLAWEEKMKLFATNRAEHRQEVLDAIQRGEIVIYDRYVPSSLAFIAIEALIPQNIELKREEIHGAVAQQEYEENKMPHEDVSIFLDVPPVVSASLLHGRKSKRGEEDEYTDHADIQQRLYNEYDWMCNNDPKRFLRIKCTEGNQLYEVTYISELVWEGLNSKFSLTL
jgi:dTMP kinase